MKRLKRIMALVIAMVMIVSTMVVPTFASEFTGELDKPITITGLAENDAVRFYQIFEYSQDATTTGGWKTVAPFTALTADQVNQILGLGDYAAGEEKEDEAGISAELAGIIGKLITSSTAVKYNATADSDGTATVATPDAGLYVALITANVAGTVYNPVFVGADYYTEDPESKTWAVTANMTYADESMAKKSTITTTKEAEDNNTVDTADEGTAGNYDNKSETVSVGDVLTFTVNTTIPEFADNYINAAFEVKDILDTGLQLQNSTLDGAASNTDYSMVIKVAGTALDPTSTTGEGADAVTTTNYSVTASATGYTITFNKDYLLGLDENSALEITYKAKVLDTVAATSVNEVDNTVIVSFSNNPTDSTSRAKEIDKTNHYTFDIDANILGGTGTPWETTEVVKVGLDADGNEITQTTYTLHEGQSSYGPLAGAEFLLYTDAACENQYTNTILTATKKIVSSADGRLTIEGEDLPGIRGLDAGTYYLKETKAPDGYIRAQDAVKIEIIPVFEEKTETIVDGTDTLTVKVLELVSYTVEINDVETADYTITNDADGTATAASKGDTVTGADTAGYIEADDEADDASRAGKITNTQGVELPSTGGIGTTIFYVVGAILVIGAGVVLITKRRMDA